MTAINGFIVTDDRGRAGIRTYRVPSSDVVLAVRSDIAPLLISFAHDFNRLVERLRTGTCWGYAYRQVRGGRAPSFHAAGIAIDLNATKHPLGERGTFSDAQTDTIRRLSRRYGMRWGGDYRKRADEMHWEIIVPRNVALQMVSDMQSPKPPIAHRRFASFDRGASPGSRRVQLWCAGDDVAYIQRRLGIADDGYFGPETDRAVRQYQARHGLRTDGIVGRATWGQLGTPP